MVERPVFIVAPPRSGAAALLGSLSRAPGVFTAGGDGRSVFEAVYEVDPANRDCDGSRLRFVLWGSQVYHRRRASQP